MKEKWFCRHIGMQILSNKTSCWNCQDLIIKTCPQFTMEPRPATSAFYGWFERNKLQSEQVPEDDVPSSKPKVIK